MHMSKFPLIRFFLDDQVERLYRDVRAYAIPGGSEEIMLDLSIRQALRVHKAIGMKL